MSTQPAPRQLFLNGLRKASAAHKESLLAAQWIAELLGARGGEVSADDVTKYISPKALGNASGAIFQGGCWEPVGFKQSERPERRTGIQRVWRLKSFLQGE
jgi:hypothetical protein